MKRSWRCVPTLAAAAALVITTAGCSAGSGDGASAAVNGVSATADPGSLEPGASIRISPALDSPDLAATWPNVIQISPPVDIEPTQGELNGQATLSFAYPDPLPGGVTPEDLMVTVYSEELQARLPVPFTVDRENRRLIVQTDHFSTWDPVAQDPAAVKAAKDFAISATKDTLRNDGSPTNGYVSRMWPETPDASCAKPSDLLNVRVVDYGLPNARPACTEDTGRTGEARLILANTHYYPTLVKLPKGVTVEAAVPEGDSFEEVMSQLIAQATYADEFFLRGGKSVKLTVKTDELEPGARITTRVDAGLLMADMALWTVGMGIDQKGAAWKELRKYKDNHAKLQQITECFAAAAREYQATRNPKEFEGEEGRKKAAQFIDEVLTKCAEPTGKAVHGTWEKVLNKGKSAGKAVKGVTITPLARQITQFKNIWSNPGVLTAWVEGLVAGLAPQNAGVVSVYLEKAPEIGENPTANGLQGEHYAFLKDVDPNRAVVTFDVVQWFVGAAAAKACREDGNEAPIAACNMVYTRNNNPLLRIMEVAPGATITKWQSTGRGVVEGVPSTLSELRGIFISNPNSYYRVVIDRNRITAIHQVFVP